MSARGSASSVAQRPIAPDLFTWPAEPVHLLGSRCDDCGTTVFPGGRGCPKCGATHMVQVELSRRGTLWTWTSQDFLPKEPYAGPETEADFTGYLVGYVELPEGVRVVTRLVDVDRAAVRIGMEMELVIVPFNVDPDGTEVLAYGFRPVLA
jgi:uncharacterized OB-fold protein